MAYLRVPLVGSLMNRNANPSSFAAKDQQFVNCYPEINHNPLSGAMRVYLYKRFGFTSASPANAIGGSFGHFMRDFTIYLSFQKTGGTTMMVFNQTTQLGGDIASTSNCQSLTDTVVSGVNNSVGVFTNSGTGLYEGWFFPTAGAWTKISDGDFPPNLGTPEPLCYSSAPCQMDGFLFWGSQSGKIWNSDLNSVSAYTANSFISTQSYPDALVGIARYKNLIVGFGTKSTEFFQNTGNATGSPLTAIENATARIGAIPADLNGQVTIQSIGDNVYWQGIDADSGQVGIYRLNGYSPQKISNAYIDKLLNQSVGGGSYPPFGICGSFTMHGMTHVMFYSNSGSGGVTNHCYCIDTNDWWIWTHSTQLVPLAIAGNGIQVKYASQYTAKTYTSAQSTFTDDSNAYTQTVQTENMDMGTMRRKSWNALRLVGDIQSSSAVVSISYSDDDYQTFSTPVTIDMSDPASYGNGITRLGQSRRRAWKFTNASNTPMRLEAFEIEYEVDAD